MPASNAVDDFDPIDEVDVDDFLGGKSQSKSIGKASPSKGLNLQAGTEDFTEDTTEKIL